MMVSMPNSNLILDNSLQQKFLAQLIEIDRINFHEDPYPVAFEWAERKPWMYTVLRRREQVVGYGLVLPLKRIAFDAVRDAKIWEDELQLRYIADDTSPDGYYLASIATTLSATERERAMIVGSTVGPLLRAPKETVAVAISESGDRICKMLQMNPQWSSLRLQGIGDYRPTMYSKPAEQISPF